MNEWNNFFFKDEIMDEDMFLSEVKLAARFLNLVERQNNNRSQTIARSTKNLIGMKGITCTHCWIESIFIAPVTIWIRNLFGFILLLYNVPLEKISLI